MWDEIKSQDNILTVLSNRCIKLTELLFPPTLMRYVSEETKIRMLNDLTRIFINIYPEIDSTENIHKFESKLTLTLPVYLSLDYTFIFTLLIPICFPTKTQYFCHIFPIFSLLQHFFIIERETWRGKTKLRKYRGKPWRECNLCRVRKVYFRKLGLCL